MSNTLVSQMEHWLIKLHIKCQKEYPLVLYRIAAKDENIYIPSRNLQLSILSFHASLQWMLPQEIFVWIIYLSHKSHAHLQFFRNNCAKFGEYQPKGVRRADRAGYQLENVQTIRITIQGTICNTYQQYSITILGIRITK
jgi:hypothetical protein